jgi:hypothetical protein
VQNSTQIRRRRWQRISRQRLRVGVGSSHILINALDQFLDAAKCSATNGPLGNPVEPDLRLIEPPLHSKLKPVSIASTLGTTIDAAL